jgi:hypothetical protein
MASTAIAWRTHYGWVRGVTSLDDAWGLTLAPSWLRSLGKIDDRRVHQAESRAEWEVERRR